MILLGFDIGSSSVKASLVDAEKGQVIGLVQQPQTEMEISAPQDGWAEQNPEDWWYHLQKATHSLLEQTGIKGKDIKGIGISYQMHGLILIDREQKVLRPAIIWCDSRAVQIGEQAYDQIGPEKCLNHLLNSPANFTASKLKWVKDHEPHVYQQAYKFLLPGDYIAMKLTGEVGTTIPGLSEGILWDFKKNQVADFLLDFYGIDSSLVPDIVPSFGRQGQLSGSVATRLGLEPGTPVTYRAGDQPNNAMSLNVLKPGEIAATGGTSGVVFGVVDKPVFDVEGRVNSFAHVNHSATDPRIGVLLCINGAGIQYRWMKQQLDQDNLSYGDIEKMIADVPVSSDGLHIIPFGNGSERILGNRNVGSHIFNLNFNTHKKAHFYRAALEGVAFSFAYGIEILREMGLQIDVIKVGNDNLFQSEVFSTSLCNLLGSRIEIMETTGAIGAARAAGVGAGAYSDLSEAMGKVAIVKTYNATNSNGVYNQAYQSWKSDLEKILVSA